MLECTDYNRAHSVFLGLQSLLYSVKGTEYTALGFSCVTPPERHKSECRARLSRACLQGCSKSLNAQTSFWSRCCHFKGVWGLSGRQQRCNPRWILWLWKQTLKASCDVISNIPGNIFFRCSTRMLSAFNSPLIFFVLIFMNLKLQ